MTTIAERESMRIVRPLHPQDSIPDFSTIDLLMPKMCHVVFKPTEPKAISKRAISALKGNAVRRVRLDAKYLALEPKVKEMRLAGATWWVVSRDLKINYAALEYCKKTLGMAKYGEGK